MASCNCFQQELKECLDSIIIDGGFTQGKTYHLFIEDKFGNVTYLSYEADAEGKITIAVSDMPAGSFMSFSGSYSIQVYSAVTEAGDDECAPTPSGNPYEFEFCTGTYDCLSISFVANTDETEEQTIPDCEAEQPEVDEPFCAPQPYESSFCPTVKNCLGIKEDGAEDKFLNEQGNYVTINPTYEESDPVFTDWLNTVAEVDHWNEAYGWGNHAGLYALLGHSHSINDVTGLQTALDDLDTAIGNVAGDLNTHITDTSNPHATTLEQARNENNQITGNIDANGNQIDNLANPSQDQQASTKAYTDAALDAAKSYTDERVQSNIKIIGDWDASSGSMPLADESNTTPWVAQWGAGIKAGYAFRVGYGQPGTVGGYYYENGDVVYALIDDAGPTPADWGDLDHNLQQATESTRGTAKVATAVIVANENTMDDEAYITGKKLWLNFWTRVLAIAHTFAAKITFTSAPRFSSVTASQFLKVDTNKDLTSVDKIQPSEVNTDSSNRFVTDTEKSTWNAKQNAIAYTTENAANKSDSYSASSSTTYSSTKALVDGLATKQDKSSTTTGTVIAFTSPKIYGTVASPETGNITDNLTGAAVGNIQKIYHNNGTAPTFPAGWVKISGSYVTSSLNIIYCEWVSGTRVEYWIVTL